MIKTMMKHRAAAGAVILAGSLGLGACDLDLTDPNSPNLVDVHTAQGLRQVAVGLQAEYGDAVDAPIYVVGLVTDEIGAIPQAFDSYKQVDAGVAIDNNLGPSTEPWNELYEVVQVADVLIDNVPEISTIPAGTASGMMALAKLYKAMAFGNLLEIYERIPVVVGVDVPNPEFLSRANAYAHVLQLLTEARNHVTTTAPSDDFNANILAPGFNLLNTIDAMIARYSLESGDLNAAATAAQRVDLGVLSELRFSAADRNPLWNMWYNSGNAYRMKAEDRFRESAEPGDRRVAYWVTAATVAGSSAPLDELAKYASGDASIPAYLPDEMRLIQAEVAARQNNLQTAIDLINQVRTPCSSTLNEPVACLPALTLVELPTQQAVLDQILYEREYELYLQGVRWSDLRRFNQPLKYDYLMVSRAECDNNTSAPMEVCQTSTTPE